MIATVIFIDSLDHTDVRQIVASSCFVVGTATIASAKNVPLREKARCTTALVAAIAPLIISGYVWP